VKEVGKLTFRGLALRRRFSLFLNFVTIVFTHDALAALDTRDFPYQVTQPIW